MFVITLTFRFPRLPFETQVLIAWWKEKIHALCVLYSTVLAVLPLTEPGVVLNCSILIWCSSCVSETYNRLVDTTFECTWDKRYCIYNQRIEVLLDTECMLLRPANGTPAAGCCAKSLFVLPCRSGNICPRKNHHQYHKMKPVGCEVMTMKQ